MMAERLSPLDVSFLYLEDRTTPMHVGALLVFTPPPRGFDYERLVRLLEGRISLAPRYRQKIRFVPGRIANPVWVDDPNFDITFHVRHSALPRPGSDAQLREFCARIQSRPLDRHRPLWEMYLIEGLADGRIAIITKTHQAMVDGINAIDIGQVLLDASAEPGDSPNELWMPQPEPSDGDLVLSAALDLLRRPAALLDIARLGANDLRVVLGRCGGVLGVSSAVLAAVRSAPSMPLNVTIGEQRRFAVARTLLEDYRLVRRNQGGTVNDVVLATIAGALRGWLLFRGASVPASATVRALVPMSVRADSDGFPGRVVPMLVDLPVGEPSPALRLAQVSYAMKGHAESGQSVAAETLIAISGFSPPTMHAVSARVANTLSRRMYNLVVANVPGPQYPLYAGGARLQEIFPIAPLGRGQAVSIGLTSYDGAVYYGLNGDREGVVDLDVLATLIEESLAELVMATEGSRRRRGTLGSITNRRAGRSSGVGGVR